MKNTKTQDNGGRLIFENDTLCSQFLRDYSGLEIMKDVQPEDIEDMTERFLPMFTEERESDVVKRVRLRDNSEIFVITLIEHKSSVDYNTVMQVFHYMSYIWEEHARKMEGEHKGITKTKDFKYPPILPIVYYEDTAEWTSVTRLCDRIYLSDVFGEYLPDYRYILFGLQNHGNAELIDKRDEISFIMLFNKIRSLADFKNIHLTDEYRQEILDKTPGDVRQVLQRLIQAYLRKINLTESEIHDYTDQIMEGNMNCLFENVEKLDIQKERREARIAGHAEGHAQGRAEGRAQGRAQGRAEGRAQGRAEGRESLLIDQVCKKLRKGKTVAQIAEALEEDEARIQSICDIAIKYVPEYNEDLIKAEILSTTDN